MPLSRITGNSFNATANTNIDNGLLFLNPTTNRVGIGTNVPTANLSLTSTGNTSSDGIRLTFGSEARPHNIYSELATGRDLLIAPYRAATIRAGTGTTEGEVRLQSYESTIISTGSSYTERARFEANGVFNLISGQIQFPATQNASSNPNTLDDYEEGTWTPTTLSSSGSITTYSSGGFYTKVGRMVTVQFWTRIITPGTAGGTLIINNLPFIPAAMPSNPGNTQGSMLVREDAIGGLAFQAVIRSIGSGEIEMWTLTNGAVSWSAGARYVSSISYAV